MKCSTDSIRINSQFKHQTVEIVVTITDVDLRKDINNSHYPETCSDNVKPFLRNVS
ncbi:MAG: hypothetical protein AB1394_01525 [Bacteroidota bacterium]